MASKRNTVALDDDQLAELRAAFDSVSTTHFYVFSLRIFDLHFIFAEGCPARRVNGRQHTLAATEGARRLRETIAICKVGLLSVPVLCLRLS